jgi:glyceraldehyde-3-phosphate dehydrogenase/erythrose-4-phosphate dehydrogenase
VHGIFNADIKSSDSGISVDGKEISISAVTDPANSMERAEYRYRHEVPAFFTDRASAQNISMQCKWLISAPAKNLMQPVPGS